MEKFVRPVPVLLLALLLMAGASLTAAAKTTITFLTHSTVGRPGMDALIEKFHREQDEIQVELVPGGSDAARLEQFIVSYAGGTPPDVLWHLETHTLAANEMVISLDDQLARSAELANREVLPGQLERHTYTGKLFAIPHAINLNLAVVYNRHALDRVALPEPQEGWDWNEFSKYARQLTRDTDGDGETDQYGWGYWDWLLYGWIISAGGEIFSMDAADVGYWFHDTEPTLKALRFAHELHTVYEVQPPGTGGGPGAGRFGDGLTAMSGMGSYQLVGLKNDFPDLDWFAVPWPALERRHIQIPSYALYVTNSGNDVKMDAAWRFVEWMSKKENWQIYAPLTSQVPPFIDVITSPEYRDWVRDELPAMEVYLDEALYHGWAQPNAMGYGESRRLMPKYFGAAVRGEMSPEEALEGIRKETLAYISTLTVPIK